MTQLEPPWSDGPLMERMMGRATAVKVAKAAGTRRSRATTREQYVITMGENMRYEVWAAPADRPSQYFDARKAIYATMGPMAALRRIFEEMKKIKGFPLATTIDFKMMMVQQQTLTEATEVRRGPIAASVFEVPAGYKKVDSPFEDAARSALRAIVSTDWLAAHLGAIRRCGSSTCAGTSTPRRRARRLRGRPHPGRRVPRRRRRPLRARAAAAAAVGRHPWPRRSRSRE